VKTTLGSQVKKESLGTIEILAGRMKQILSTQTTLAKNTSAQHSILLSSKHKKKYLQKEFTILQLFKEAIPLQNKPPFYLRLKQPFTKASLSLLILPQPLPFNPSYLSKPQWQDNRKRLASLLAKSSRKHRGLMLSPIPLMVLSREIYHPCSMETGKQPKNSWSALTHGRQLINKIIL